MPERLEIGAVLPFHATALGNPVLAYLEDGVRADLLSETSPKLTGRTLASPAELRKEVDAIRERGYAVEREAVLGEAGVAAPVLDRRAEPIGAIGTTAQFGGVVKTPPYRGSLLSINAGSSPPWWRRSASAPTRGGTAHPRCGGSGVSRP
jgi:hypothetical protein